MSTVLITGNTFPVKDQIKALGGRWDADAKGWKVPAEKSDAARALVAGGGASQSTRTYRPTKCRICGHSPSKPGEWQNGVRIRRDGICWDCATDH
ncbi:MAG: hypothetical protein M3O30_17500 [Planctomycetota bacterium]|nr:hypothetical protein [Planctomycetota bacterium]